MAWLDLDGTWIQNTEASTFIIVQSKHSAH